MTATGYSSRHCFMNAYRAVIPWQSTPSLFLSYHAPGAPRPTPCAVASAPLPARPRCTLRESPLPLSPWHGPPSSPASPSALTGVLPPPPERALGLVPPSPPQPETRACSLACYDPFISPRWLSLPIRSVRFFQDTSMLVGGTIP